MLLGTCCSIWERPSMGIWLLFVLFCLFRWAFSLSVVGFPTFSLNVLHLIWYHFHVVGVAWANALFSPGVDLAAGARLGWQIDIQRQHWSLYLLILSLKLFHSWVSCLSATFEDRGRARVSLADDQAPVTCYLRWRFLLLQICLLVNTAVFCFHHK